MKTNETTTSRGWVVRVTWTDGTEHDSRAYETELAAQLQATYLEDSGRVKSATVLYRD